MMVYSAHPTQSSNQTGATEPPLPNTNPTSTMRDHWNPVVTDQMATMSKRQLAITLAAADRGRKCGSAKSSVVFLNSGIRLMNNTRRHAGIRRNLHAFDLAELQHGTGDLWSAVIPQNERTRSA
jgi:hypothetical protein